VPTCCCDPTYNARQVKKDAAARTCSIITPHARTKALHGGRGRGFRHQCSTAHSGQAEHQGSLRQYMCGYRKRFSIPCLALQSAVVKINSGAQ